MSTTLLIFACIALVVAFGISILLLNVFNWILCAVMILFIAAGSVATYYYIGNHLAPQISEQYEKTMVDVDRKIASLKRLTELDPTAAQNWFELGLAYRLRQDFDSSVEAFRHALKTQGANPEILAGLGESLVLQSQNTVTDEAVGLFEQTLNLQPTNITAQYYKIMYNLQKGDVASAQKMYGGLRDQLPASSPLNAQIESAFRDVGAAIPKSVSKEK
jgi:cytochrome c-type biogenesis protein CcmH